MAVEILATLTSFIINTISNSGYFGIFLLMVAESALIPIPSEVIMPFSGYLVSTGKFGVVQVILAGSIGNLVGSLAAYFAGAYLGRGFILRYGKYILLKKSHLEGAEAYFKKYGAKSTFISRLLPAIRTYVSLPAGTAKMGLKKFAAYTFVGSIIWNAALTFVGIKLGQEWDSIRKYSSYFDAIVIIAVIAAIIIYWRRRKVSGP
ncbi:MAG TPA: DedA family protein [Candidatus Nitrosotalea sp.]|nr:DedA family protein [Candidatus Nitrosotalea sp.]